MKKDAIEPTTGFTVGFGIFYTVLTQILALGYLLAFGEREVAIYGSITTSEVSWPDVMISIAISLGGLITGLILVSLGKCVAELSSIRIILNQETGRVKNSENENTEHEESTTNSSTTQTQASAERS